MKNSITKVALLSVLLTALLTGCAKQDAKTNIKAANNGKPTYTFDLTHYANYHRDNNLECPVKPVKEVVESSLTSPTTALTLRCDFTEPMADNDVISLVSNRNSLPPSDFVGYLWVYVKPEFGIYPQSSLRQTLTKYGANYALKVSDHPLENEGVLFFEMYRSKS